MEGDQTRTSTPDFLGERLDFMAIDQISKAALRDISPLLRKPLAEGLDRYAAHVRTLAETRLGLEFAAHQTATRQHLEAHWHRLITADFNTDYANAPLLLGDSHARFGLEPRWFIGGYAVILETLVTAHLHNRLEGTIAKFRRPPAHRLGLEISALIKAALLDIDISCDAHQNQIIDTYRHAEIEAAFALDSLTEALGQVARGNLRLEIPPELSAKYGLGAVVEGVRGIIVSVHGHTDTVRTRARKIANLANGMADHAVQQAESASQITASIDTLERMTEDTAAHLHKAKATSSAAQREMAATNRMVTHTRITMAQIARSWDDSRQFLEALEEIARQANQLLSGAGKEETPAAPMVVQRISDAAQTMRAIVEAGATQIHEGLRLADELSTTLARLADAMGAANNQTEICAHAAQDLTTEIAGLKTAASHLGTMTHQNLHNTQIATTVTADLTIEVVAMSNTIRKYQFAP